MGGMYTIDFHTHSIASADGGMRPEHYSQIIEEGILDYIAITDHNTILQAIQLKKLLGEHIIIGEEISTSEGEIIGLFLKTKIEPWQPILDTARAIKAQGGLVYIPHPLETVRHGLKKSSLDKIVDLIDIVEVHNGRAIFQNRGPQATTWARLNRKLIAASSDAHGVKGVGTTYTLLSEIPTHENLCEQLKQARFITNRPPLHTLLYPKLNRIRKKINN